MRLSYAKDPASGSIEVLDRNDYYPFGMNFVGNNSVFDAQGSGLNYKFQEQELQETGFYAFKWRNYMPDVGRFFNVDPLATKYPYNSTYAFSENRVVNSRELEGLEAWNVNNSNATVYGPYSQSAVQSQRLVGVQEIQGVSWIQGSAELANARLSVGTVGEYSSPPYAPCTNTLTYETPAESNFVRVYTEGSTSPMGRWMMRPEDIAGLSPQEIQTKFALPNTPTNMVDVNVPAGTNITKGEVAPNFGQTPPQGTTQFELRDQIPTNSFSNPRPIPMPEPVVTPEVIPEIPVMPEMIEPIIPL